MLFAVEWVCLLRFQVYRQRFVTAEPWIRGATAERWSYVNKLLETNIKRKEKNELENQPMFENTLDWVPTHVLRLSDPRFYVLFHFQDYFPEREAGQPWIRTRLRKGGWALRVSSVSTPSPGFWAVADASTPVWAATDIHEPTLVPGCKNCRRTRAAAPPARRTATPECYARVLEMFYD